MTTLHTGISDVVDQASQEAQGLSFTACTPKLVVSAMLAA
jgi:hypothetical protein